MLSGRPLGLTIIILLATTLPPQWAGVACAQDRMRLGAPDVIMGSEGSIGREFRGSVGDRVFFADRSAELSPRARLALDAQAQWLKRKATLAVVVEGHADDSGTSDDNMQLSHRRADAVRARLIELGIATERIAVAAFGRNQTVADCMGLVCAAQNRRVVTVIRPAAPGPHLAPDAPRRAEAPGGPSRQAARRLF
jgi:outer membrane protein OmpA-like peptidoglycan-associated protein